MKKKTSYKKVVFVGIVILVVLLLRVDAVQRVVVQVFAPLQGVGAFFGYKFSGVQDTFGSISNLKQRVEDLTAQNMVLQGENERLRDVQQENDRLRTALDLPSRGIGETVTAEVIGRDSHRAATWVMVNKGSAHGMQEGAVVVVFDATIVGIVDEVFTNSARIHLLTHPESAVNAVIRETGAQGIVRGSHGLALVFDDVLQQENIPHGAALVTSELNGRIKQGLSIGTVEAPTADADGLFQRATVHSPVDLSRLQFVSIIL